MTNNYNNENNENKPDNKPDNKSNISPNTSTFINFFITLVTIIIILGLSIIYSSIFLYECKVAQTNLLPTCFDFFPYTNTKPEIYPVTIDINIVKTDDNVWSTKLESSIEENLKAFNKFEFLKNWTSGTKSNVYTLYLGKTLEQVLSFNFKIRNNILNFINSIFSESFILLLSIWFELIIVIVTTITNYFYLTVLWFFNVYLLFSEKEISNNKNETIVNWKNGDIFEKTSLFWLIVYILILLILFFSIGFYFIIPVLSIVINTFCFIFPIFINFHNVKSKEKYSIFDGITNVIKYKLHLIMYIITIYAILSVYTNFGGYSALVSLVSFIILLFFSQIYNRYIPKDTDNVSIGLGTFQQAIKKCKSNKNSEDSSEEPSLIEKIENIIGLIKKPDQSK